MFLLMIQILMVVNPVEDLDDDNDGVFDVNDLCQSFPNNGSHHPIPMTVMGVRIQ